MILSSGGYLDARFSTPGSIPVSKDLHDAIKALNEATHQAMRLSRGTGFYSELLALRIFTDALVDLAKVSPVWPIDPPIKESDR